MYSLPVSVVENQHTSSVVATIARVGNVSFSNLRSLPYFMSLLGDCRSRARCKRSYLTVYMQQLISIVRWAAQSWGRLITSNQSQGTI